MTKVIEVVDGHPKVVNLAGKDVKSYRCLDSHPTLELGGGVFKGGRAFDSAATDFDVYVGLTGGYRGESRYPWNIGHKIDIDFYIADGSVPSKPAEFRKMIDYLCNQLQAGKRVHVGCIGGHGRTGTVLSALVAQINGEKDAIQWVRKHYCKKAVETDRQIEFLHKEYGITKASATKPGYHSTSKYSSKIDWGDVDDYLNDRVQPHKPTAKQGLRVQYTAGSNLSLW